MIAFAHHTVIRAGVRSGAALLLALLAWGVPARAQQPAPADTMYQHAHRLVSSGQGALGRALIDSLLLTTPPGTPVYAEGLFWRAVTALRVEDAERDYLRIVIEFPLSARAGDALIRLAELEMMRGDRNRAQRHLQRLIIEHPNGANRARASYWLARVYFDGNDLPRACNELNVARARAGPGDVELRHQLDYQAQRCVGVNVVVAPAPAPAPVSTSGSGLGTTATVPPGAPTSTTPPAAPAAGGLLPAPASAGPPATTGVPATTRAPSGAASGANTAAANPGVPPGTASPGAPATPIGARPSPAAATPPAPVPASAPATPAQRRAGPEFTVQVAAFPTRAAAETFMESLQAKGYDVRVWGTEYPFRVRIGRFATRAEATRIAQELRSRMISKDAFVTEAEVR